MKAVFYKLGENILTIFRGKNIFLHIFAIVLTYIAVVSEFDWVYYVTFKDSFLQTYLFPAIIIGIFIPIFLPIILYLLGMFRKHRIFQNTAYAVAQAGFLGWLISSFYKAFTGRIQPPFHSMSLINIISSNFQFGFLRHGIFWG